MPAEFSIAQDYDPDGDMSPDADPVSEYLTYLSHVHAGAVGDMGFTLDDFKRYISAMRRQA